MTGLSLAPVSIDASPATRADPRAFAAQLNALLPVAGELSARAEGFGLPPFGQLPVRPDRLPTVVVVGEQKQGKSRLVNALVGRPGVSPVSAEVATAVYVMMTYGDDDALVFPSESETSQGVRDLRDNAGRTVSLDQVAAWSTVEGLSANPEADVTGYNPVVLRLKSPELQSIEFIDTPGTGGLRGEHAEMTKAAIRLADAMLFVTDATCPLTATELDFLGGVAGDVAQVIFVLSMSDKLSARQLADSLSDVREKLLDRVPQFAHVPILTVSAQRAEVSQTSHLPLEAREEVGRRSGITELKELLRELLVERRQLLHVALCLQHLRRYGAVAAERLGSLTQTLSQADSGELRADDLQFEQRRQDLLLQEAGGNTQRDLRKVSKLLVSRLHTETSQLKAEIQIRAGVKDKDDVQAYLQPRLDVLANDLVDLFAREVDATLKRIFVGVVDEAVFTKALTDAAAAAGSVFDFTNPRTLVKAPISVDSVVMSLMVFNSGDNWGKLAAEGLGMAASAASGGAALGGPPGILVGILFSGGTFLYRQRQQKLGSLRAWMVDIVNQAERDLVDALTARLEDVTGVIQKASRAYGLEMAGVTREKIRLLKADRGERLKTRHDYEQALARALTLRDRAAALLDEAGFSSITTGGDADLVVSSGKR